MDKIQYLGLESCLKIANSECEVVVATAIGPRILRYAPDGGPNALGEFPEDKVATEWGDWRPIAGHRLWAAPEGLPFSYAPDSVPVEYRNEGELSVVLIASADAAGVQKEMRVTMEPRGFGVEVWHRLTNARTEPLTLAPWALTVFRHGQTILPLEPYRSHDEAFLPTQPLVLWSFSDLADPRVDLDKRRIRLSSLPESPHAQKFGLANRRGWAAHYHDSVLFVKRFPYLPGVVYPDFGCNCEIYAQGQFMEVESLGPLATLQPGQSVEHLEIWNLTPGLAEDRLDSTLAELA